MLGTFLNNFLRACRTRAMESVALFNMLTFESSLNKSKLGSARTMRVFDNWEEGRNWMSGRIQGAAISIFDLHTEIVSRSSKNSGSTKRHENQTIFLLERPEPSGIIAQFLVKKKAFDACDGRS